MAERPKHLLWFIQSEADLSSVRSLIDAGHFAQACFNAQQAAEKSLKALAFFRGADLVKSHSRSKLVRDLQINGDLARYAPRLDLYYLTARYPDALAEDNLPSEEFTRDMADEAFAMADAFVRTIKVELKA